MWMFPAKFTCWQLNPQDNRVTIFRGDTFGRKLALDEVMRVAAMVALQEEREIYTSRLALPCQVMPPCQAVVQREAPTVVSTMILHFSASRTPNQINLYSLGIT